MKSKLKGLVNDSALGVIQDEIYDSSEPRRDREQKIDYIEGVLAVKIDVYAGIDSLVISDD